MDVKEFSNEFDVLLNSYSPVASSGGMVTTIGLDEYEKSVYLTQAQESVVLSLYNGKNPFNEGFENTEELRRYLDGLETGITLTPYNTQDITIIPNRVSSIGSAFKLPSDLWFITHETVNYQSTSEDCRELLNEVAVVPVTQDEYNRIRKNPFRGANIRRALRLDIGKFYDPLNNEEIRLVQIIPPREFGISRYHINYISKPSPIILTDLPDGLEIENSSKAQTCLLNPALHRTILQKAVMIAVANRVQGQKAEE